MPKEVSLEVPARRLVQLDGLEQGLEVPGAETAVVVALDDLEEHRRPVLHVLGEDLQQVAVVVEVDQDVELLDGVEVLHDLRGRALEALTKLLVVRLGHHQEVHAPRAEVADRGDDVLGVERDVLDSRASVVVDVLLDLALPLPRRWLVDGHLDGFLPVGHDDGAEGGVLGVDLRVIHRPEPVEHEVLLVPGGRVLHLQVGLVADDVVDEVQADVG